MTIVGDSVTRKNHLGHHRQVGKGKGEIMHQVRLISDCYNVLEVGYQQDAMR